ncbi:hypothetical protein AYO47_02490 [Planctomyces sp. SCGC AG-212-M04]|nr:hypothetical protein AYO47_02490 [Planctomyces sp. SCGC AG-212-M04]
MFAARFALAAVIVFCSFAARWPTAFFAAGPFRVRSTSRRCLVQARAEAVVGSVFRLNESCLFGNRSLTIPVRFGPLALIATATPASASATAGASFLSCRRLAAEADFGVVEAGRRRSIGLPETFAKRIVFFCCRRWSFAWGLTLRLRAILSTSSASSFLATAGTLAAGGTILARSALVSSSLIFAGPFFTRPFFPGSIFAGSFLPVPTSFRTTGRRFGMGFGGRLFGFCGALRAPLGTLGASTTISAAVTTSAATAITPVTASATTGTFAPSAAAG